MIDYRRTIPRSDILYQFYCDMQWEPMLGKTPEELHRAMSGSWMVLTVWESDHLIAMGRIVSDGALNSYLCGLGVLHEYRNQGIGTHIVQYLVKEAKAKGLAVQLFAEEKNVSFFEKQGFQEFACGLKR